MGKPRFRLSCREADWLGENDRKHLASVSPDSQVKVLRLDPLTDADIASILDARPDIPDARAFIEAARRRRSVEGLLPNPQTLRMLADVVGRGSRMAGEPHADLRDGLPSDGPRAQRGACRRRRSRTVHLRLTSFSMLPGVSAHYN